MESGESMRCFQIMAAMLASFAAPFSQAATADNFVGPGSATFAGDSLPPLAEPSWGPSPWQDGPAYCTRSGWFAGADYRLVRTHFSEAIAFATLTASVTPAGPDLRSAGNELNFSYQSSFAVYAGYHLS